MGARIPKTLISGLVKFIMLTMLIGGSLAALYFSMPYIQEFINRPNPKPTPTPIEITPVPSKPVRIKDTTIKNHEGSIVHPLNETFYLKPLEKVTIVLTLEGNDPPRVRVEYSAIRGRVMANGENGTYAAPNNPGGMDLVTVKVLNVKTGDPVAQKTLKIKIITTQ